VIISSKLAKIISKILLAGSAFTTLVISPSISFDPFNTSKFALCTVFSMTLLAILLTSINLKSFTKANPALAYLSLAFLFQSILILSVSKTPITLQLFGIDGRHTGFILYFNLLVLLLATSFVSGKKFSEGIVKVLILVGLLNAIYGLIQFNGWDPIDWNNGYSPVIGFFGNPNFQSAFIGIAASALWAFFFGNHSQFSWRITAIIVLLLLFFIIVVTDSQQGIIVYIFGFALSSYIAILKSKKYFKISKYYGLAIIVGIVIIVLDILQKVPWNSILYKQSVSDRGDLWRAAWRMANDNPLTGVGFDSYEYFYRAYRDSIAIVIRGDSTTSNSAHNIFLDILSSGGFLFLAIYIGILFLVFFSALKVFKRETEYNPYFTALFVAWLGYQIQSLISINQIGVAIWGWILSGAIIGYESITSGKIEISMTNVGNSNLTTASKVTVGMVVGIIIGIVPVNTDVAFKNAIDSRQIALVQESAYKWPQSPQKMFQVAAIFRQNSLFPLSAQVAKDAVVKFPRSYENWELLSTLENISDLEKKDALDKMKELDPLNPNIK
jgi:O-antigen ligase